MTIRSVIIGLILAAGFACRGPASAVWSQYAGIGGDLAPNYVYGVVLIGLVLVNPVLRRLGSWRLRPAEWVVILSMPLMGVDGRTPTPSRKPLMRL